MSRRDHGEEDESVPATDQGQGRTVPHTRTDEWAYAKAYASEAARRAALPTQLHAYNNHHSHTPLGGHPPASRVLNLTGQNP
jgi:transposase InsO family protein